ncbi:MAG: hypothetical protein EB115_11325 [Betaproteobacteria bacterium]|nr:hypothetical protein [Betaproteobacteria bacterium]
MAAASCCFGVCGGAFAASCKRLLLSATFVALGAEAFVVLVIIDEQSLAQARLEKQVAAIKDRNDFIGKLLDRM